MNDPARSAEPAASPAQTADRLLLPPPEQITISWLVQRVPVKYWITLVAAFSATFSAGMGAANLGIVQSLFATRSSVGMQDFVNKAVTEKGTYTVGSGLNAVEMHIVDVSIARSVVTLEIGLVGHAKQRLDVVPNVEKSIVIGAKAYVLVVHDLADSSFGPDIAVLSFRKLE